LFTTLSVVVGQLLKMRVFTTALLGLGVAEAWGAKPVATRTVRKVRHARLVKVIRFIGAFLP
jgi:hypothetical protein